MLKRFVMMGVCLAATLQGGILVDRVDFIRNAIERMIEEGDPSAHVGIEVMALGDGATLYRRGENYRFVPASSLKLFTAAAALGVLGPDYRFRTEVRGKLRCSVILGDCYLVASGDPSLGVLGLEELVLGLKEKGVKRIERDLVLDLSVFDDVEMGPGWMWDEEPAFWCSPLSGLNVEHNCVRFSVKPAAVNGESCLVSFEPDCKGISVVNLTQTREDGDSLSLMRREDGAFMVTGSMEVHDDAREFLIPVKTPSIFAGNVMKMLFEKHGIVFRGSIKIGQWLGNEQVLAAHQSDRLEQLLHVVLKKSDNLYADALFKKMGKVGTWESGAEAVRGFLKEKVGLDVKEMVVVDGSGQSRYNLISPHQMLEFLKWIHESFEHRNVLKRALSIGGVDGTLSWRMQAPFFDGRVSAKTGSMTGVSALCGFVTTEEQEIAFALFVNNYVKSGQEIKEGLEDRICQVLVNAGL